MSGSAETHSRLEQEAYLLARSVMYNWRANRGSSSPSPTTVESLPSFAEYVTRGIDDIVANNNDKFAKQDSLASTSDAFESGALPESATADQSQRRSYASSAALSPADLAEEDLQKVHDAVGILVEVGKDVVNPGFLKKGKVTSEEIVDELTYTEYRQRFMATLKDSTQSVFGKMGAVLNYAMVVLDTLESSSAGAISPQSTAMITKYTTDLIASIAYEAGLGNTDGILDPILKEGRELKDTERTI